MRCGKTPEDLTERQTAKLAWIAKTDPRLHRAYILKEGLRHVFTVKGEEGNKPWTGGSPGHGAPASRYSSSWPAASCAMPEEIRCSAACRRLRPNGPRPGGPRRTAELSSTSVGPRGRLAAQTWVPCP